MGEKKNKMEATDWPYQSDRPDQINPNRQLIGTKKVLLALQDGSDLISSVSELNLNFSQQIITQLMI